MVRNILAAIAGYILLSVAIVVLFSIAFLILGVDWSFKAGTYEASAVWIAIMIVFSFGVAVMGGYVAKAIAKDDMAVKILVGIILVIGFATAFLEIGADHAMEVRPDEVPLMEAMMKGIQPLWLAFLNPILGAAGVLIGGRLRKEAPPETAV